MIVQRYDSGRLAKAGVSPSGGARLSARLARTGIQVYRLADGSVRREYRPPSEVFAADSLASFVGAILTLGHPLQGVTPHSFQKDAAGVVVAPSRRKAEDGHEYVEALIDVARADAIKKVDAGELAELSAGYRSDFDPTPGIVPEGEPQAGERYDGVQRNIRVNHVALLGEGRARAGRGARLLTDELQLDSSGNQVDSSSLYLDSDRWDEHLHGMLGKEIPRIQADHNGAPDVVEHNFKVGNSQTFEEHEAERTQWAQHREAGRAEDEAFTERMRALHGKDFH